MFLVPVYLTSIGETSATSIGLVVGIVQGPILFKIPLTILSDRYNFFGWGHRRPYMFIALVIATLRCALREPRLLLQP